VKGLTIQAHDNSGYAKRKQQIRSPGSASPESDSPGIWRLRDRPWALTLNVAGYAASHVVRRIESPAGAVDIITRYEDVLSAACGCPEAPGGRSPTRRTT